MQNTIPPIASYLKGNNRGRTSLKPYYLWITALILILSYGWIYDSIWIGSGSLHTTMETIATLLALQVGAMSLVRHYSRKEDVFLLIGVGFLGTGFLDGYHAIVTSSFFSPFMPSDMPSLIPWSWIASRFFLSLFMVLSWLYLRYKTKYSFHEKFSHQVIYSYATILTMFSFVFFAFVPLPAAYFETHLSHRPAEFVPAILFAIALYGYIKRDKWRTSAFEYWLVLSLIVGFITQIMIMPQSSTLFDVQFDLAHLLKKVSYIFVMIGLMLNMYTSFRSEIETRKLLAEKENWLRTIFDNIKDALFTFDSNGIIKTANPSTSTVFGFSQDQLVGNKITKFVPSIMAEQETEKVSFIDNIRVIMGKNIEMEGMNNKGEKIPLEVSIDELFINNQLIYLTLARDINERKIAEKAKSEFISTVSHELRTPLTSIQGALGLINSQAELDPEQREKVIKIAQGNAERLTSLVNDLLDMESLQAGEMRFNFEHVSIHNIIAKSIENNQHYADKFKINLKYEHDEDIFVNGDENRLEQVMANLLSNAIKFSPEGETVEIKAKCAGNSVRVSVFDNGYGIAPEYRDKIFSRFTQADSSDTRKVGGSGLGLFISKAIISSHNGVINFNSNNGSGTEFYFKLKKVA